MLRLRRAPQPSAAPPQISQVKHSPLRTEMHRQPPNPADPNTIEWSTKGGRSWCACGALCPPGVSGQLWWQEHKVERGVMTWCGRSPGCAVHTTGRCDCPSPIRYGPEAG